MGASRSNLNSNFASVNEQSGFRAGDAGFAVNVTGNTTLTGGVITSTQTAVDNNANSFTTGGTLSITDVQNTASFSGQGGSIGISVGVGQDKDKNSTLSPGGSAGFGTVKGDAASTTTGGISGIAGNTAVRTGDANTGLTRIFDPKGGFVRIISTCPIRSRLRRSSLQRTGRSSVLA